MTKRLNRWVLCTASLCLLIFIGCDTNSDTLSTTPLAEEVDFGDPYAISGGDHPPLLDTKDLHLTVQYSGGCRDHEFDVRSRMQNDTIEVWLQHDSNGDLCEAYLTDPLTLRIPEAVRNADHIVLLGPDGQRFMLR